MPASPYIIADKTYFYIKDFRRVPTFSARPYVAGYPSMVSYMEIPLLSASGYILGSYCVVDNKERDFMQPTTLGTLREVTSAISSYLDMKRAEASKSRSERMMDGLRQFVGSDRPNPVLHSNHVGIKAAQSRPFEPDVLRAALRRDPGSHATDATSSTATVNNVCRSSVSYFIFVSYSIRLRKSISHLFQMLPQWGTFTRNRFRILQPNPCPNRISCSQLSRMAHLVLHLPCKEAIRNSLNLTCPRKSMTSSRGQRAK